MRRAARLRGGGDVRVDEDLYSRQLHVKGHAALARPIDHPPHRPRTPVPSARFTVYIIFGGRNNSIAASAGQLAGADARPRGRPQFRRAAASIRERRMGVIYDTVVCRLQVYVDRVRGARKSAALRLASSAPTSASHPARRRGRIDGQTH